MNQKNDMSGDYFDELPDCCKDSIDKNDSKDVTCGCCKTEYSVIQPDPNPEYKDPDVAEELTKAKFEKKYVKK